MQAHSWVEARCQWTAVSALTPLCHKVSGTSVFQEGPPSWDEVGGLLPGPGWTVQLNNASLWPGRILDPVVQGDLSASCAAPY